MKRLLLLSILPVLLVASSGYGYHHWKSHGKWVWWEDASIVEELKLDDKQKSQISEVSASYKGKLEEMRSVSYEKRKAFKGLMGNPDSTRQAILKAFDEMWDAKYKSKKAMLEMKLDMRAVLTADQITKLNQIREQHKQEMMEKHKKQ